MTASSGFDYWYCSINNILADYRLHEIAFDNVRRFKLMILQTTAVR